MLDFLFITILVLIIFNWYQSKPFFWKNKGIPYTIPLPFFGSTANTFVKPFYQVWMELYNTSGDNGLYGFHFFGTPSLMVKDPDLIKRLTVNDADHFMSHGFHTDSQDPMTKGLFFLEGDEWRSIRRKMTPYFTPLKLKELLPIIHPIAEYYAQYIISLSKKGPVDVQNASMKLAVDAVVSTVFGLQPDAFINPNSYFFSLQKEMISFITGIKFMIGELSPLIYSLLGLTVFSRNTTKKLQKFSKDVTQQRLNGIGNRPDFIQGMVDLMQKEQIQKDKQVKRNEDGTPLARFDQFTVAGQCIMMYSAGTETTGNTLAFLLYELALNQEIQEKVRDEINAMIKNSNGDYGFQELHDLKYLHMVLSETLRKYPIVTFFSRKCTKDIVFDGIKIPAGTVIMSSPIGIQNDPQYFPQPDEFIPERFLHPESIIPGTYIPFGMGPRTCIGVKFAQTEIALALCKLLPKVRLSPSNSTQRPIKFSSNPSLSPLNGIMLNIEQINSSLVV